MFRPAQHAIFQQMHVQVSIEGRDPLRGEVIPTDGGAIPFSGRLGLMSALERLTADRDGGAENRPDKRGGDDQ